MEIKEINFDTMETVRKKCITFARNRNTIVKPYKTLYRLEDITHDTTHKNLYLEIIKDKKFKGDVNFCIFEDLQVICIKIDCIPGYWTIEKLIDSLSKWEYFELDGFYKRLNEAEKNGCYINEVDIRVCNLLGNIELAKHYSEYRENKIIENIAKRQAEKEARDQKEREEEEELRAEIEKIIVDAENKIFHQENLENIEIDGKPIISMLLEKYRIKVPIRTKGWINSNLAMITFNDKKISYRFYGNNSTVFKKYLIKLENAINKELNECRGKL